MKRSFVLSALTVLSMGSAHASLIFGTNAILNPGAESGLANWTFVLGTNSPEAIAYGTSGFPTASDPGPASRGLNFFAGGPDNDFSGLEQTLDVSNVAALIDAGLVTYKISGWQGGKDAQPANAALGVSMYDAGSNFLFSNGTNYNNSAADRGNVTGLFFRPGPDGLILPGTRKLVFQLLFMQGADASDHYSDAYIDNVSFVATAAVPEPGSFAFLGGGLSILGILVRKARRS